MLEFLIKFRPKRCGNCKFGELLGKDTGECLRIFCVPKGKAMGLNNNCPFYKGKWYVRLINYVWGI